MAMDRAKEFSRAKMAAFRLLKIRERSIKEIREKLTLKEFSPAIIDQTIEYLLEKKFLNDQHFARNWIRYRQARPFGSQRIQMELRQKGIAQETIVREIKEAFEDQDQDRIVCELASRRAKRYANEAPDQRKKKVFDFLARRGFGLDSIKKAIKTL